MRCTTTAAIIVACTATRSVPAQAPAHHCAVLCAPIVTLMPAMLRTHLFGGPRVQTTSTGATHRLPSATDTQLILAMASTTAVPRLSAFASTQWVLNASETRNPFTQYTANELGGGVRANAPTFTVGLSAAAVTPTQTKGWADLNANVADLFSQAARPDDKSAYTHKLDLELVAHVHVLNTLPAKTYAHRTTIFAILDYVASGLPRAGDEVPPGRRFLDDARPFALLLGLALPLTPEVK